MKNNRRFVDTISIFIVFLIKFEIFLLIYPYLNINELHKDSIEYYVLSSKMLSFCSNNLDTFNAALVIFVIAFGACFVSIVDTLYENKQKEKNDEKKDNKKKIELKDKKIKKKKMDLKINVSGMIIGFLKNGIITLIVSFIGVLVISLFLMIISLGGLLFGHNYEYVEVLQNIALIITIIGAIYGGYTGAKS